MSMRFVRCSDVVAAAYYRELSYIVSSMPPATQMRWISSFCSAPMSLLLMSSLASAPLSQR
jgi:hypothetical protein